MQNMLVKIPYKFKRSYGGAPEPQTFQDAPRLHGPSLKNTVPTCFIVLYIIYYSEYRTCFDLVTKVVSLVLC
jgi:hypothetical protein